MYADLMGAILAYGWITLILNWILIFVVAMMDAKLWDDRLEHNKITGPVLTGWVMLSIFAIPLMLIASMCFVTYMFWFI